MLALDLGASYRQNASALKGARPSTYATIVQRFDRNRNQVPMPSIRLVMCRISKTP